MARLEAAFPYSETEDQARAIEAVKEDLESEPDGPPDLRRRRLRQDRGRAARRLQGRERGAPGAGAGADDRARQQHLQTFRDRFRDFPLRIELVSRMRSAGEVRAVLADYAEGKVDVLIGTHRVLSRDVVPKTLGLVIVDEEQRFGVAQKELLRALRLEVDVLSLSATPIPRTLHMSLAGLRDISIIATPPTDRKPIRTHVGEWDEELVAQAIRREHERGGQSFFLHNRVETIDETAEKLRRLVPEVRVGVAHGQMRDGQLEERMLEFLRGDHDVLCSTTIIESGLDIPQANTLIVDRADLLGMSQAYQIRGRVGRSSRTAHAYLLYPDGARALERGARAPRDARRPHRARLGLPDRDARPRAARRRQPARRRAVRPRRGDRLRALLRDARRGGRGARRARSSRSQRPVRVDAGVDAYVPPNYVPLEAVKIDVHRRIALAGSVDDLRELRIELADRFGPPPEPVENLLLLQEARLKLAPARGGLRVGARRPRDDRQADDGALRAARAARRVQRA